MTAMAATGLVLFLVLQSFFQQLLVAQLDEAMPDRMEQHEMSLQERVTELLQGLEQAAFAWAAPLLPALQQWHFWAIAAVLLLLLLLLGLGCWLRKRGCQPGSSNMEGTTTKKAEREEAEEKARVALQGCRISAQRLLDLSESFTMVEELVDELLRICHKLCRNSFMPEPRPVIGVSSSLGGWNGCEEDATYRLLVPLKPPRGHAFHVDMGTTTKGTAEKKARLHVELQCTCMREPLAEDMLCFLHHPEKELKEKQPPSLLRTLCNGPYLDIDKTSRWLQVLLKRAWAVMPQSAHCRLTVLPSRHSCNLRLTHASGSTIGIEMLFGIKQGESYIFLN